jgi:hypothetical protein
VSEAAFAGRTFQTVTVADNRSWVERASVYINQRASSVTARFIRRDLDYVRCEREAIGPSEDRDNAVLMLEGYLAQCSAPMPPLFPERHQQP